jgi:hypothetical protein
MSISSLEVFEKFAPPLEEVLGKTSRVWDLLMENEMGCIMNQQHDPFLRQLRARYTLRILANSDGHRRHRRTKESSDRRANCFTQGFISGIARPRSNPREWNCWAASSTQFATSHVPS